MIVMEGGDRSAALEKYFALRRRVFIDEQKVDAAIEIDEFEELPDTVHVVAIAANGDAAGAGRLVRYAEAGTGRGRPAAKLGRVCVAPEYRGLGLGKAIVKMLIEEARRRGYEKLVLHSQAYVSGLYEKFGFAARGGIFKEAGIDHLEMAADVADLKY